MALSKCLLVRPNNPRVEYHLCPASTAFSYGDVVAPGLSTGGAFTSVTSSTKLILGRILKTVASTDSDYTSTKLVPIEIDEDGTYEVAATAMDTDSPQNLYDFSDGATVAHAASTYKNFLVTKYISATKVQGKITRWANRAGGVFA